jgi:hypothetical protein
MGDARRHVVGFADEDVRRPDGEEERAERGGGAERGGR